MKGLARIPSHADLAKAYAELESAPRAIDVARLAEWADWSRFDPRLAGLWVAHVRSRWRDISPFALNAALRSRAWPAAGAVLAELAGVRGAATYPHWVALVTEAIAATRDEGFFIGLRALGGALMLRDATEALPAYRRWGFFGSDPLAAKSDLAGPRHAAGASAIRLPSRARREALARLIAQSRRFSVSDYLALLSHCISRRQAELDLAACRRIRPVGRTRSRFYVKAPARTPRVTARPAPRRSPSSR